MAWSAPAKLCEFFPELVHVVLPQYSRRDEHLMAGGNARFVTREALRHEGHSLIPELERLLHHRARDRTRLDARECLVLFVEGDDRHLADLVRVADGVEDRRAVITPEADKGGDLGMGHKSLGDVRFGAHAIGI